MPWIPRSVCFPLAFSFDTYCQIIVGHPNTQYCEIKRRLLVISLCGMEAISSFFTSPLMGNTLKMCVTYCNVWNQKVSGRHACISNDQAILKSVCHVRSVMWFWYWFFGAARIGLILESWQCFLNSPDVNCDPWSAHIFSKLEKQYYSGDECSAS